MQTKALMLPIGARIDWSQFEQSIHERFDVNAVALDKNGNRKTAGAFLLANDLCKLIKNNLNAKKRICDALQRQMINEARVLKRYITQECLAGIYRRLLPIIRDNEIVGYVSVCGRPLSTRPLIYADYIHEITGVDRKKIDKSISTLNPIGPRAIKKMTHFIIDEAFQAGHEQINPW
jgi:ligand-binding sensor protein